MKKIFAVLLGLAVLISNASGQVAQPNGAIMPALPKGKETDVKFYSADGSAVTGRDTFERKSKAVLSFGLPAISFSPWTMSSTRFKKIIRARRSG